MGVNNIEQIAKGQFNTFTDSVIKDYKFKRIVHDSEIELANYWLGICKENKIAYRSIKESYLNEIMEVRGIKKEEVRVVTHPASMQIDETYKKEVI